MEGRPAKRRRKGEACGSLKDEQLGDGIRENSTAKHSTRSSSQNAFYLSELNEGWSGLHSHPRFEKRLRHLDDCQSPLPLPPMSPWSSSSSRHDRRNNRSSRRRSQSQVLHESMTEDASRHFFQRWSESAMRIQRVKAQRISKKTYVKKSHKNSSKRK